MTTMRRLAGALATPHGALIGAAIVIEGAILCLVPTVFLVDGSDGSTRLGSMFIARYPGLGPIVYALKSGVDWVFPGALWSWPALISCLFWCFVVAFVAYAVAAWLLSRPHSAAPGLAWIVVPLLAFQLSLIVVPASMTTDIYNYVLYGEMPVLYGANPFVRTPAEFPQSPLYYLIPLYWHDAPSVYGPLWISLSVGVASLFRAAPLADELLTYRLIANLAHLANALLIWTLARRLHPERAPSATLAYAWNPLLLVDFALNGHNDVLMLTLVLVGLVLASGRRPLVAPVAIGLSVATKYTSVLVAPLLVLWIARQRVGWRARARALIGGGLLVGLVPALLYLPWIEGRDTFSPVLYWMSGPRLNNFWPEPTLITLASWSSGVLGTSYEAAWSTILEAFKLLAKVGLGAFILITALRVARLEDLLAGAAHVTLLFLLLVNTWVMPWYYTWPLTFAAALGWQSLTVRVCAGFSLTAMVLLYQRQYSHAFLADWGGLMLALPLLLAAAGPAAGWIRRWVVAHRARPAPRRRTTALTGATRPHPSD